MLNYYVPGAKYTFIRYSFHHKIKILSFGLMYLNLLTTSDIYVQSNMATFLHSL